MCLVIYTSYKSLLGVRITAVQKTLTLLVGVRFSHPQPVRMHSIWLAPGSHTYWGLVQLVERQILTLKVKGSSPLPPAKSKSKLDRPSISLWKTVGRGIRSVHRLKSGPRFSTIPLVFKHTTVGIPKTKTKNWGKCVKFNTLRLHI